MLCLVHIQVFNQFLCNTSVLLFVYLSGHAVILIAIPARTYLESTVSTSKKLLVFLSPVCYVSDVSSLRNKHFSNVLKIEGSYPFDGCYFSNTLLLMNQCIWFSEF